MAIQEQLVALLGEKTGLEPDKANQVIATVIGFLKDNPEKLTELMGGGDFEDVAGKIGKLFGR